MHELTFTMYWLGSSAFTQSRFCVYLACSIQALYIAAPHVKCKSQFIAKYNYKDFVLSSPSTAPSYVGGFGTGILAPIHCASMSSFIRLHGGS